LKLENSPGLGRLDGLVHAVDAAAARWRANSARWHSGERFSFGEIKIGWRKGGKGIEGRRELTVAEEAAAEVSLEAAARAMVAEAADGDR
jgi:hypothetical protein